MYEADQYQQSVEHFVQIFDTCIRVSYYENKFDGDMVHFLRHALKGKKNRQSKWLFLKWHQLSPLKQT